MAQSEYIKRRQAARRLALFLSFSIHLVGMGLLLLLSKNDAPVEIDKIWVEWVSAPPKPQLRYSRFRRAMQTIAETKKPQIQPRRSFE